MKEWLAVMRKSGKAAFSTREFAALAGNKAYARVALHRLKKRGESVQVRKGWWAFPDALPEAIACEISKPAFVSFHTALYLHGLTKQIHAVIQLAVTRYAKTYFVLGNKVREYKIRREDFNHFTSSQGLLLATPEKALADCLNTPRACPEIILKEAVGKIDLSRVKRLVSPQGNKRLSRLEEDA